MRGIPKTMISCQLGFYPLGTGSFESEIGTVLELISSSGLDYETGEMSTILKGQEDEVYALLLKISQTMRDQGVQYVMQTAISNACGFIN